MDLQKQFKKFYDITILNCKLGEFNGLEFWHIYKDSFKYYDSFKYQWNFKLPPLDNKKWNDIVKNQYEPITNHFLYQIYNIPKNEECNFRKIMQISLNIAQYNYYTRSNIKVEITDFINKETIKKIENDLSPFIKNLTF